ncbi:hypothetical protein EDD21DRAFT_381092 [Dissophora ornata]|nr:hypothetical protein EDD21DRAFT_381092 [Dissophora ornata]
MSEHGEQVISTESEPVVTESEPVIEIVEEVQPDGTIIRRRKTTRRVTTRVLKTVATKEGEHSSTTTTNTTHEVHGSNTSIAKESEEAKETKQTEQTTETKQTQQTTETKQTEQTSETKSTKADAVAETESPSKTTEESTTTERSFKYRFFGEGNAGDHPLYKFLARFPLKQSPAPHTRPRPVKVILYAYAPGWKTGQESLDESSKPAVGSFDVDSLKWMTYLKFSDIEFEVKPAFEPSMSPSGKLPFLALSNGSFITSDGFEAWVQENKSQSATAKLDLLEAAESLAFITLAESKIHAALLYTLWFEPSHFYTTTRQHYFGHYNWLLTKLLSYLEKSNVATSMLLTRTQIDRELIFEEAATAIESLAVQLGDENEYFFGKSGPSALDAVVFSYLHVILTLPRIRNAEDGGRSGELTRIVRKHENLYRYSQNIWKKWFAA